MILQSVIQPRRPLTLGHIGHQWRRVYARLPSLPDGTYEIWAHDSAGLGVISAVEVASEAPGLPALGPAYHLSVSAFGKRCTGAEALWMLSEFGLLDAKEDNHVPSGKVRHFWRYVADNLSGYECRCIETEPAIREDKGDFIWRG